VSDIIPADSLERDAEVTAPEQNEDTPDAPEALPVRRADTTADVAAGTPGFLTLAARVTALSVAALRLKENLWALRRHMENNADKARALSEMCDQAEVEPQFTAQILEVSAAFRRVAEASGELADTADVMEVNARGFNDAHDSEYRGVYEAVQKSAVRQPKPGFNQVK
jgi:hypothetical protein